MSSRGIGDWAPGSEAEGAGASSRKNPEHSVLGALPATPPLWAAPEDRLAGGSLPHPQFPETGQCPS